MLSCVDRLQNQENSLFVPDCQPISLLETLSDTQHLVHSTNPGSLFYQNYWEDFAWLCLFLNLSTSAHKHPRIGYQTVDDQDLVIVLYFDYFFLRVP